MLCILFDSALRLLYRGDPEIYIQQMAFTKKTFLQTALKKTFLLIPFFRIVCVQVLKKYLKKGEKIDFRLL